MNPNVQPSVSLFTDEVLTERQICDLAKISPRTAQRLRQDGSGPPYVTLSPGRIGYLRSDVINWLLSRRVASTSAATVRAQRGSRSA